MSIDLQLLLSEYENRLCDRIFHYDLLDGTSMDVVFYREQFCHLLGIQHVFQRDIRYSGASGYKRIRDKKVKTETLKKHDKAAFNEIKERLLYFCEIENILLYGEIVRFYMDRTQPRTNIEADFLIYRNEQAHIFHLFLRKERDNGNQFAPVSFVVKTVDDPAAKQYIDRQQHKKITSRTVLESKATNSSATEDK